MSYIPSTPVVSALTKTAAYTILPTDPGNIFGDTSAGAFSLTLPDATTVPNFLYRFKNIGSVTNNLLKLQPVNSQTIDGAPSRTLMIYDGISLQSVGGNWVVPTGYYPAVQRSIYGQTTVKAGDTLQASSVAAGVYQNFASNVSLPANSLLAGLEYIFEGNGLFTTALGGPSTTASVLIGSTDVLNTGALSLPLGNTNWGYYVRLCFKITSVGTSGVVRAYGHLIFQSASGPNTCTTIMVPSADKTIDTTVNNLMTLRAAFSTNGTGNSNTLRDINFYEIRPPKAAN